MDDCIPCCDYCKYYFDEYSNGKFSGYGRCMWHLKAVYASEDCRNFKCVVHEEKACHVDEKMFDEVYDHCLCDVNMAWDCEYAAENNIKDKKECKFWR